VPIVGLESNELIEDGYFYFVKWVYNLQIMNFGYGIFLVVVGSLVIHACSGKTEHIVAIDPELREYVDQFIEEGRKRGYEIAEVYLDAQLVDTIMMDLEGRICGYGRWGSRRAQLVEIVDNHRCWQSRSRLEKENLVFHELGHALLNRGHDNEALPNNITQHSIMCSRVCSNFLVIPEEGPMREYYLDELFDYTIDFPSSIHEKVDEERVYYEDFENSNGGFEYFDDKGSGDIRSFEIEHDVQMINGEVVGGLHVRHEVNQIESLTILKNINLGEFVSYPNLRLTAEIYAKNVRDVRMGLGLIKRNPSGDLERFRLESKLYENLEDVVELELEIYAIPDKTDLVSVFFIFGAGSYSELVLSDVAIDRLD